MKTILLSFFSIILLSFAGAPEEADKFVGVWNAKTDSIKKTIIIRKFDGGFNVHIDGPQLVAYSAIGTYENGCLLLSNFPKEEGDTTKYTKKFNKDSKICYDKAKGTITYSKVEYKKIR